jgi:coronin-1B/1C/6
MASFIRQSKFRHVFGQPARKDGCMEGFRVTNCAFEGNFISANGKFVAACVEVGGGGAFIVLPVNQVGRLDVNTPKVSGHKEYILDIQWNPFNDNMIASCSEDGCVKIWEIPEKGLFTNMEEPLLSLDYHERRCVQIAWHPVASNVLLSVSQEPKVCVWNLDDGVAEVEIAHPDHIYNAAWSQKGDRIVTSCKDKAIRIFDARTGESLFQTAGHEGSKGQRVIFILNDEKLLSTGFSRMSERQYCIWNLDEKSKEIKEESTNDLDTANSCLVPHYDADCGLLYLAGKGDSVIRYYEIVPEEPFIHYINTYQSKDPQRGIAAIPKRSVNVNNCEVVKFYKLHGSKTGMLEPISMTVPRKSDLYQSDLYPPTCGPDAAMEASEWFEGANKEPIRIDMAQFFISKAKPGASGGGLKKGGLKGLKGAKKEQKAPKTVVAAAAEPVQAPARDSPKQEPKKITPPPQVQTKKESPEQSHRNVPESKPASASSSASSSSGGASVDPRVLQELQDDMTKLRMNDRKHKDHIAQLEDKLKDYEKLTGDIKLLCDAVKKNDERIAALEALVQEESDDNEGE